MEFLVSTRDMFIIRVFHCSGGVFVQHTRGGVERIGDIATGTINEAESLLKKHCEECGYHFIGRVSQPGGKDISNE